MYVMYMWIYWLFIFNGFLQFSERTKQLCEYNATLEHMDIPENSMSERNGEKERE